MSIAYEDLQLNITEPGHKLCAAEVVEDVVMELFSALQEHGDMASPHEGYAVILEEVDELWDEIKSKLGTDATRYGEAKQVAAMAIRFMITFGDGRNGTR